MSKRNVVIALSGFKGSGKDTVAGMLDEILSENNIGSEIISFNNGIYDIISMITGDTITSNTKHKDVKYSEIRKIKNNVADLSLGNHSIRSACAGISDSMKKLFGKTVWVNILARKVKESLSQSNVVIIPDVRFESEISFLNNLKQQKNTDVYHFVVFRKDALPEWTKYLWSPNDKVQYKILQKDFGVPMSEIQWTLGTSFSGIISNDGSFTELQALCSELLSKKIVIAEI